MFFFLSVMVAVSVGGIAPEGSGELFASLCFLPAWHARRDMRVSRFVARLLRAISLRTPSP